VTADSFKQMTTIRNDGKTGNLTGLGLYQGMQPWGKYFTKNGGGFNGMGDVWIMYPDDKNLTPIVMMKPPRLEPPSKESIDYGKRMLDAYTAALQWQGP